MSAGWSFTAFSRKLPPVIKRAAMWLGMATASWLIALPAPAQPVKVGFINMVRIERESKRPQQDAERLKQEFAAREAEVRSLHAKVTALQQQLESAPPASVTEAQRRDFARQAQQFEQVQRSFFEDLERRKAEERQKFLRDLQAVVNKVAKAQNLDLVLQEAVYASRGVDITDQVLKALAQSEGGRR